MECTFCRIVAGTEPSQTVHEDEHTIAFLKIAQATNGHSLVVPRVHYRDLGEIPVETAAQVMRAAVEVSRRLASALGAPGVNLWHAGGETAWQSVFHFHLDLGPPLRARPHAAVDRGRAPAISNPPAAAANRRVRR